MSLTSRFFKKPWQHKNPESRIAAIQSIDDPELIRALPDLAEQDDSSAVRLAALRRINSEAFWLDARLRETEPELLAAADQFLSRCATESDPKELDPERLAWAKTLSNPELIKTLAASAREINIRAHALQQVQAQGFLGDCYASETDAALAESILRRINQLSTLERLHGKLRKQNKQKSKAVQNRLQEIQASHGEIDLVAEKAQALVDEMEALSRGEHLDQRQDKLTKVQSEWGQLDVPPAALQKRFDSALTIVEAAIARPLPTDAPASEADIEPEQTIAADGNLQAAADKIRGQLRNRQAAIKPGELLAEWDRAWNALAQAGEAEESLKSTMLPILKELQLQVQNAARQPATAERSDASKGPLPDFGAELDALSSVLVAGDLQAANARFQTIRGALKALPPKQCPSAVTGRLQRLDGRFRELRDYQHWSNNSHRDELIEKLEALPGSGQHPDAVTAVLKEARTEWKRLEKLEILPGDKRRFAAPSGQWRRFQAAAKAAFDSAKPYFEKRQGVQEETLEQLHRFIDRGKALARSEDADSKALMPVLRKAREAIRRLDELPPKARGAAAGGLRDLMSALSGRLDQAFEQVERAKRRLINEAKALANEAELKDAIDRAKGLQAEWKRAGQGRRRIDQKLWTEFRSHIDPLFEKLDGERKARQEANQAVVEVLKQLCVAAEEIAMLPEDQLEAAQSRLTGLANDWNQRHPKPAALVKRFDKALKRFEQRLEALRDQQRQQVAEAQIQAALAIQNAYEGRLQGKEAEVDIEESLPEALVESARRVAEIELSALQAKALEHVELAAQVAIEFEFLSGLDSPAEEKERRMNYQVQRLAARMSEGEAQRDLGSEVAELEERWHLALPLPPDEYHHLQQRIKKCQTVLQNMLGNA
ncbi:MAG: DUF349 domain-containing protein [Pseudomonadota bacterium]